MPRRNKKQPDASEDLGLFLMKRHSRDLHQLCVVFQVTSFSFPRGTTRATKIWPHILRGDLLVNIKIRWGFMSTNHF